MFNDFRDDESAMSGMLLTIKIPGDDIGAMFGSEELIDECYRVGKYLAEKISSV